MARRSSSGPPAGATAREAAGAEDSPFRRNWSRRTQLSVVLAGRAIAAVLRLLYLTFRVRIDDPDDAIGALRRGEPMILTFWHDALVLVPYLMGYVRPAADVAVMLSWHRDAEIAAQAIARFGIRSIRGSARRGRLGALRGLLVAHQRGEIIVIVPDGPKGPPHQAKEGVAQLARATGLPVVAIGAAARPARRLGSWDRMQVPAPFARVAFVFAPAVRVGAKEETPDALGRMEAALATADGAAHAAA